jgi:hypothetical protein
VPDQIVLLRRQREQRFQLRVGEHAASRHADCPN